MELINLYNYIKPLDDKSIKAACLRWSSIAKPLHGLGLLEDTVARMAGIFNTPDFNIKNKVVLVMCADNGVVFSGVTQTGQEVTAVVANNISEGNATVCKMANVAGASVLAVDVGVATPLHGAVINKNVKRGTNNFVYGPAMTVQETMEAIKAGVELVQQCKSDGYTLIATGEMGIGNTTTSSAIASVLLDIPVETATGRGAGLSDEGLIKKINAIKKGIELNKPNANDPTDVLSKLGGLDIAALVGVCLGGAVYRIPILLDGFISSVAALVAIRMCSKITDFIFASHASKEPASQILLKALDKKPLIYADLCLGEGTGAVAAMPMLDMAMSVYSEMVTFSEINIDEYTPQKNGR